MTRTTACLVLLMVTAPSLPVRAADADPRSIVQENTGKIRELVVESSSEEDMREKVKGLLEQFIDFEEFGRLCLGKRWPELTGEQQKTYLVEFRILLQRTYLRRFKPGREFTVDYRGDTRFNKGGDRAEVKTTITSGEVSADVDYRFHRNQGWKVYDIVVDEVSIRRSYRKSFVKVLKREGFDALIARMRTTRDVKKDDSK